MVKVLVLVQGEGMGGGGQGEGESGGEGGLGWVRDVPGGEGAGVSPCQAVLHAVHLHVLMWYYFDPSPQNRWTGKAMGNNTAQDLIIS